MNEFSEIWVYLRTTPLMHLTLTLVAYQIGNWIYKKTNLNPLFNPVLIAMIIIVPILLFSKTNYSEYFQGAQFVHFLLGPATVALAIPLYQQFEKVKKSATAISISIFTGSLTAMLSALLIGKMLNASNTTLISLAPKSTTTPIAMGITEQLGGLPSLTAILVIVTGIFGAMVGPLILNFLGIKNKKARGLAIGTASHGIGTARAYQINKTAGTFAGLAMGINALATALLLPLIWNWLF